LGNIRITDVELVYSSSFLAVCSRWEAFLEEILYEAVCGDTGGVPENRRLASFRNRKHLEQVLLYPGKDYLSISSVREAERLAALFVKDGMPISVIDAQSRTYLQQATWIRNAVAHQSSYALEIFRTKVPGVTQLTPTKRFPGAFLRHEFRQSPSQKRCELYFAVFQKAAKDVAAAW